MNIKPGREGPPACLVAATDSFGFLDVFTENPDEKSIITYVVAFYHYFSKMKQLAVEGKRVGKVSWKPVVRSLVC